MHTKIALLPLTLATLTGGCAGSTDVAEDVTENDVSAQDPDETAEATVVTTVVRPTMTTPKLDGASKDGPY